MHRSGPKIMGRIEHDIIEEGLVELMIDNDNYLKQTSAASPSAGTLFKKENLAIIE